MKPEASNHVIALQVNRDDPAGPADKVFEGVGSLEEDEICLKIELLWISPTAATNKVCYETNLCMESHVVNPRCWVSHKSGSETRRPPRLASSMCLVRHQTFAWRHIRLQSRVAGRGHVWWRPWPGVKHGSNGPSGQWREPGKVRNRLRERTFAISKTLLCRSRWFGDFPTAIEHIASGQVNNYEGNELKVNFCLNCWDWRNKNIELPGAEMMAK